MFAGLIAPDELTTAVAALVAVVEPLELEAVTATRNVLPTSVDASQNVDSVPPSTAAHAPPALSQRCH